ncbi:phytoene/squalene synthase family protein [bacterium SCSIO 12643]|nr:phytoene/squalene synthase family protein [bacterium SCSIO 12643]
MKTLFDEVSYECSKEITKKYSTSFSLAVKMLSPKIQDAIYAIYGFVRVADEIVDSFHAYDKEELLDEFEANLKLSLERKISLNPVLNSFQEVVHRYHIDYDLIDAFLKSMRADLHKNTYTSFEGYQEYIYGSADVVGLMCLKVFVSGDAEKYEELKGAAMKLGSAFQKVNFLRDFKEDSDVLDRTYFPHLYNKPFGVDTKKLIIEEIKDDFEQAYIGIKKLPLEARFGVYTAYIYYKKLLKKLIQADVEEIKMSRIRVSNPTKMALLAKSFVNHKLNLL